MKPYPIGMFVLAACASDPAPHDAAPQPAAQLASASKTAPQAETAEPVAKPQEEPAAPEPEPAVRSDGPPTLNLSTLGRCSRAGLSAVGDEVFMHRSRTIHRMGPEGTPVQDFPFTLPLTHAPKDDVGRGATGFGGLYGRWPDQLFAVVDYSERDFTSTKLARWADDDWVAVKTLDRSAQYSKAWPWHSNSVLAFAVTIRSRDGAETPRLAVVRGAPKGPKLGGVLGKAGCRDAYDAVLAVDVDADGPVSAVVSCKTTWLAQWPKDGTAGTTTLLSRSPSDGAELALAHGGEGFVLLRGKKARLFAWHDGQADKLDRPKQQAVKTIALDADGALWVVQRDAINVWREGTWHPESLPPGSAIEQLAGTQVGDPWLFRRDKSVWNRTADGAWNPVALPPAGPQGKIPRPLQLIVPRAGDAWVSGEYFKLREGAKNVGRRFEAVYTQRPVETPYNCAP